MAVRSEREKSKMQERYQMILSQMLKEEDNKYCVDCDTKNPRWASWNIGVFICIRCAGFHRNLGVHISKVKSVNLDSWTGEQVASIQAMGNSRARAVYEANLPDGFRRPQTDSALESLIRAKYEQRKWIAKEWIPPEITVPIDLIERDTTLEKPRVEKNVAKLKPIPVPTVTTNPVQSPSTTRDIVENTTENLLNLDDPLPSSTNNSNSSSMTIPSDILDPLHELFTTPSQTKSEQNIDKDFENAFSSTNNNDNNNGILSNEKILALFNTPQTTTGLNTRPISMQSHNLSSPTFPYVPSQHSHLLPHQKSISFSNNLYQQATNFTSQPHNSNSNSTFTPEQLNTQFSQLMPFGNTKSDSLWQ